MPKPQVHLSWPIASYITLTCNTIIHTPLTPLYTKSEWLLPPDNQWRLRHWMAIDTESVAIKPQTDYWHRLYTGTAKCYHWLDTIARISNQLTIACTLLQSVCSGKDSWFPQGTIYQGQLAMTLGSRGQLHINVRALCAYTICFKISSNFTSHWCTYTLCKSCDIQSSWKNFLILKLWTLSYVI